MKISRSRLQKTAIGLAVVTALVFVDAPDGSFGRCVAGTSDEYAD